MGVWAAALGPVDDRTMRLLLGLGDDAEVRVGTGFAVAVRDDGGERVRIARNGDGAVTATLGCPEEAGSSVTVRGDGPSLTLRRDPFGVHGVAIARAGETVWCSSGPRLLGRIEGISRAPDPAALHGYLCFSYVPAPHTLTEGIRTMPAGAMLRLTATESEGRAAEPWRESELPARDEGAAVEQLRRLLRDAVARRLEGAREAGVFLSGGLDSSLVAALLVEAGAIVHLFTLDFGPPFDAELPYARLVAAHLGRPLHVVPAGPAQVRAALDRTAAALHQPFGDPVTAPLFLLGEAAAREVDVVFNGEGGDQLFGGWTTKPMIAAELYGDPGYDREAAYQETFHRFHGLTHRLYTARARVATAGVDTRAWVRPALRADGCRSLLHRLRAANLLLKGAQNIAPRAAQLAAAHGLRLRMPFFDRALAAWTFTLPPEWFLRGACEKYLLKRAAEPLLPATVVWREKRGMGVPATEWLLGPLRRETARRLSPRRLRRDGWFEPSTVGALLRGEDQPGEVRRRRLGERLWTLLMLRAWSEQAAVYTSPPYVSIPAPRGPRR